MATGVDVRCVDVSESQLPWDIETEGSSEQLVERHFSLVRATREEAERMTALIRGEFVPLLTETLRGLGARDVWVRFNVHDLPHPKKRRPAFVKSIGAAIVLVLDATGGAGGNILSVLYDLDRELAKTLHRAFNVLEVRPAPAGMPGILCSGGSDLDVRWAPPLSSVVIPTVRNKQVKHGDKARDLSLVVELVEDWPDEEGVNGVRMALSRLEHDFQSIYLAKVMPSGTANVVCVFDPQH